MCGEQFVEQYVIGVKIGSPPRVRGTGNRSRSCTFNNGITPACAGNRNALNPLLSRHTDHPRVCGEQEGADEDTPDAQGSPPRVRGTDAVASEVVPALRITPACAGNSAWISLDEVYDQDPPRVCGEQQRLGKQSRKR